MYHPKVYLIICLYTCVTCYVSIHSIYHLSVHGTHTNHNLIVLEGRVMVSGRSMGHHGRKRTGAVQLTGVVVAISLTAAAGLFTRCLVLWLLQKHSNAPRVCRHGYGMNLSTMVIR